MPVVRTPRSVRLLATLLLAALALLLATAAGAHAQAKAPAPGGGKAQVGGKRLRLAFTRCSSTPFPCQGSHSIVVRTGRMLIGAGGMTSRAKVEFPVRTKGGRLGKRRVGGTFRTATRLLVRVPADAISGRIRIVMPGPRYSNSLRITVRKPPVKRAPARPPARAPTGEPTGPVTGPSVFDGSGMWVWYLSRAEGGDPDDIAAKAKAAGVRTLYVKSADGTSVWSQFTRSAVSALQSRGLRVCGWQYVYGRDPIGEARAAAASKAAGADCFVIDAETEYEGKYAQAQRYVNALREAVGPDFPIGFTSFPYVHYHPSLPYSVFMGPGGATANLPQVYWKDIGTSVDASLQITYQHNGIYETPIYPLGQAYGGTAAADLRRFRQLSDAYGARGTSWWVWDYATAAHWDAVGADLVSPAAPDPPGFPLLRANGARTGSKGDQVVWAQQHLAGAGYEVTIDGAYGPGTARVVRAYQTDKGLQATGVIDEDTWPTLLREEPVLPNWAAAARASKARASVSASSASRATAAPTGPSSAALPAKRYEIRPEPRP